MWPYCVVVLTLSLPPAWARVSLSASKKPIKVCPKITYSKHRKFDLSSWGSEQFQSDFPSLGANVCLVGALTIDRRSPAGSVLLPSKFMGRSEESQFFGWFRYDRFQVSRPQRRVVEA